MKIFYLLSRIPYPIDKGDKLRAYHQLRILSRNHEIYLFALNDETNISVEHDELKKISVKYFIKHLTKLDILISLLKGFFSDLPFQTSYFNSKKTQSLVKNELLKFQPDLIVCQLIRMAEYVPDSIQAPQIIDYIDVLSKGLERRKSNSNFLMKPIFRSEYKRVLKYEEQVFNRFNNGVIITENDRNALPFNRKNEVKVIPNGIDFNHFYPLDKPKDIDLVFAGNMSYPPNIDAVEFIVKKVLPILKLSSSDIKFYIVGASPARRVKKLANENVIVTGWVNDIRDYYARSKVFVAPMQIGTGLQNKILEAMSMSLPCIVSSLAQGGIQAENNKNIFVADDPVKISELIILLLSNEKLRNSVGENAREFIVNNYDWEKIIDNFDKYLSSLVNKNKTL
ncbi:MAG: hypothetical protein CVV23_06090 [Ignavibacteriae bacterium HGW-Ignavibacteriae-2]|nr:MAG: hypothetical protein CVV23_06090 [Ignavibacteriae bacterium HGW-Ignavibacteriae-2]